MRYPRMCNWFTFKRMSSNEYLVTDHLMEKEYVMDPALVNFALKLDGEQDPFSVDPRLSHSVVKEFLRCLRKYDMIRDSRVAMKDGGMFMYTLWIPKTTAAWKFFSTLLSRALLFLWIPLTVWGILQFADNFYFIDMHTSIPGLLLGLFSGMILHELGHGCTAAAYGASVFEFGISLTAYCMPGAYTLMDFRNCKRMQHVQILAAGVEMNFLLTGVFLACAAVNLRDGGFWYTAGIVNASLALINLVFGAGLDGFRILIELLGGEFLDFAGGVESIVRSKEKRKKLRQIGISGHAVIVMAYFVALSQLIFPVLILVNILGIIGGLNY